MPESVRDVSPTSAASIEIRLRRLQQLFNSLDPSPFHERDLDQEAEDYIVESADEFPLQTPLHLVVYLPRTNCHPLGHLICRWPFTTISPIG
jgi:hypothetical protein